jgi:hypothetical protein
MISLKERGKKLLLPTAEERNQLCLSGEPVRLGLGIVELILGAQIIRAGTIFLIENARGDWRLQATEEARS